jgi:hypothetical protein
MSAERKTADEGFLGRWSRRKLEARESAPADLQPAALPSQADEALPELPPVEELTIDSDFRGFLHPKVDENVRRAALRKLFSDPHFNVMDGLDVYIDDYSKTEPIPATMLAGLRQAQRILSWAEGKEAEGDAGEDVDGSTKPEAPACPQIAASEQASAVGSAAGAPPTDADVQRDPAASRGE